MPLNILVKSTLLLGTTGALSCPQMGQPETCAEIREAVPSAGDDEYVLYLEKDKARPWVAYCHDMAGEPREYLPLDAVGPGRNFSQYTAGAFSPGTDVRSSYTRVRIDPIALTVDIDDRTFASSTGQLMHGNQALTEMPFAVAMSCGEGLSGVANVDLTGTPFKLNEPFCTVGFNATGQATLSQDDKVADLIGRGACGYTEPRSPDGCLVGPNKFMNGSILDLAYVGD